MIGRSSWLAALIALLGCGLSIPGLAQEAPPVTDSYDFGTVLIEQPVTHAFHFANPLDTALEIRDVQLSPPLVVTRMPARIAPGAEAQIEIELRGPREPGAYQGWVLVNFKDAGATPLRYLVTGTVAAELEFKPYRAVFLAAQRGETKRASVEIAVHSAEPIVVRSVEPHSPRFATELEAIEPGRKYRLWVALTGQGAAGKQQETLTLLTDSARHARLTLPVHTLVRERVYSFPDALDFGPISPAALQAKPDLAALLTRTLMVYQKGGTDFRVTAESELPIIELSVQRSTRQDRYQIEVRILPERLAPGPIRGEIRITTNDSEFPRLSIPVQGFVEADGASPPPAPKP